LPDRILIVRAGALGDTLMTTPTIRALKQRDPQAEVDYLCSQSARPLLEENPGISRLFSLEHRNVPYFLSPEKHRLARALRERQYRLAVLLESGPQYRELIQHAGAREIRDIRDTFDARSHSIINYLRAAGCEGVMGPMDLYLTPRDEMRAAETLRGLPRPWIGFHAGYGPPSGKNSRQQSERLRAWSAENFVRLGRILRQRHGGTLVLTGSTGDVALTSRISAMLGSPEPLVLAGRTSVREMAAIIELLDVLVTVDSAPAHIAAVLGTRTVVLWGPAIFEQTCPHGDPARLIVVRHPVSCAPCYGTPLMKQCQRNICMEAISPTRVAAEVEQLLVGRNAVS
jgi:ADP-heptose:LPS heptosyltransferase